MQKTSMHMPFLGPVWTRTMCTRHTSTRSCQHEKTVRRRHRIRGMYKFSDPRPSHMTEHSPSCCFCILLLEMRSRCRGPFLPDLFKSSRRSLALVRSWAVHRISTCPFQKTTGTIENLPAARQYHRFASSMLPVVPIPTSVK